VSRRRTSLLTEHSERGTEMTESWILLTGLLLALHWGMLAIWEDMHPGFISIAMSFAVTPELVEHALKAGIVQQSNEISWIWLKS
jgi:hypothetical protein